LNYDVQRQLVDALGNTHHVYFFTKLSSDQLRIQSQLGGGHLFDEILYHMSYISDMDHVCYISKQKEKRSKEMKRG